MRKIILLVFFSWACKPKVEHQISGAFYHWKTQFRPTDFEKKFLEGTEKIYVKFFDLDLENGFLMPKAVVNFKSSTNQEIVPTIYIVNKVFRDTNPTIIADYLKKSTTLLQHIINANRLSIKEIQIDCDWTKQTKLPYFHFLRLLKKQFPDKLISATIRLHQVKFPSITGVPPVDKGMLMCYNMADWKNEKTVNSIYNPKVLEQYTDQIPDYPLDLDLAMPIFRWSIVYRNGIFLTFINHLDVGKLKQIAFIKEKRNSIFEVEKDSSAFGIYFKKNDVIRAENVDFETLKSGTKYVISQIKNKKICLSFYHLDSLSLNPYSYEKLRSLFASPQ